MTAVPWQEQLNLAGTGENEELERQGDHKVNALKRRKELFLVQNNGITKALLPVLFHGCCWNQVILKCHLIVCKTARKILRLQNLLLQRDSGCASVIRICYCRSQYKSL